MRPILLLHGFTGSPASFRRIVSEIGQARCIVPALVGERSRSFDDEIERLTELCARERVHVAGYSMGARLGLGLLVRHPELCASATLIGVHPGLSSEAERAQRRAADAAWCDLLEREGLEAFVAAWEAQPLFRSQMSVPQEIFGEQRAIRRSHSAAELARTLRVAGLGQMPCFTEALGGVQAPVTLMVGEHDEKFCALAESMQRALPSATVQVVSGAGHNPMLEQPELVARAIAQGASA